MLFSSIDQLLNELYLLCSKATTIFQPQLSKITLNLYIYTTRQFPEANLKAFIKLGSKSPPKET